MRAFVAVPVPPAPEGDAAPRAPDHLTLAFLRDLPDAQVAPAVAALRPAIASVEPFAVVIEGVGAFPSPANPRVVFQPATVGAIELVGLADRVRRALAERAIAFDPKPFVPHVTVLRVRGARDRELSRALLDGTAVPPARALTVREVLLVSSALRPGGAIHRPVARFDLGLPPAG